MTQDNATNPRFNDSWSDGTWTVQNRKPLPSQEMMYVSTRTEEMQMRVTENRTARAEPWSDDIETRIAKMKPKRAKHNPGKLRRKDAWQIKKAFPKTNTRHSRPDSRIQVGAGPVAENTSNVNITSEGFMSRIPARSADLVMDQEPTEGLTPVTNTGVIEQRQIVPMRHRERVVSFFDVAAEPGDFEGEAYIMEQIAIEMEEDRVDREAYGEKYY